MRKLLTAILATVLTLTMLSANGSKIFISAQGQFSEQGNNVITANDQFPKPVGNYTVGRTQMDFTYRASDNLARDLTAIIFYPSDSSKGKPTAEYAFSEFQSLRDELVVKLGGTAGGEQLFAPNFKTWSYDDLALSKKEKQYPVLFFSHGAGAYPQQGTLFSQDLASAGYIVVLIGHPGSGVSKLKDGRIKGMTTEFLDDIVKYTMEFAGLITPQISILTEKLGEEQAIEVSRQLTSAPEAVNFAKYAVLQSEDISYVADRLYEMNSGDIDSIFKGRLQLEIGMGVFGHSFGGTTAALVSRDDDRFVGAVNLDGNMLGALDSDFKKPFMQLGTVLAYNTNAFLLESNSKETYFAIIDNVVHSDFSDSLYTGGEAPRGTRDAMEQRTIISSYTKAFFDRYLLKKEAEIENLTFDGVEMIKRSQTFVDIQNYGWAREAIETLSARGVITGVMENRFSPSASVTRADFILMLVRALGLNESGNGWATDTGISFSDVDSDSYYADALHIAKSMGIAYGQDNNHFRPESEISRQDMMVLIERALKLVGKDMDKGSENLLERFSDWSSVSEYAQKSIATLVADDIITGDGTKLKPLASSSRAEAAVMIYRVIH
ncbi:S-layer homology domain-containing protein [Paenibacillus sp. 11B]|uniref:S-layer homology domain-containing protein n=1 Tax=Paenibacillus sp. 11B TaxID=3060965 RepID=UPI0015C48734|nr:S-layer homology domain-containing protein [Paenibacillus sp. 11B]MDN8588848.1 S-layer homology domain-containing protein [Paenibacillus sp. 11B]